MGIIIITQIFLIMALFVVLADELEEEILPLTFSNNIVKFSNDNITFAQFEYNTNQL